MKKKLSNAGTRQLLLISSYGEILLMLNLMKESLGIKNSVIVFDNEDLYKFLIKVKSEIAIDRLVFVPRYNGRKKLTPLNYLKEKKYYNKCLKETHKMLGDVETIHCFALYQNHFCFQVIFSIIEKVKCVNVYTPVVCVISSSLLQKFKNIPRKILNKFLFGSKFTSLPVGHKNFDSIEPKILSSAPFKIVSRDACDKIKKNTNIQGHYIFRHSYKYILFDQPLVNYGRVSNEQYSQFIKIMKKVFFKEIADKTFCVKLHPGNHTERDFYNGIEIIGGMIPSQSIECRNTDVWMAISSQAIWEEMPAKRVALIDLIEFKDDEIKATIFNNFLETRKGTVLMPKTSDDLINMLSNSTNNVFPIPANFESELSTSCSDNPR